MLYKQLIGKPQMPLAILLKWKMQPYKAQILTKHEKYMRKPRDITQLRV